MDFLSNIAKGGESKAPAAAEEKPAATNDLMTSAKEAGAAAQAGVMSAPAKAAGAAADLLEAGSEYAKLDETKGVGKYVEQTETYLRDYSKQPPAAAGSTEGGGAGDYIKKAQEFLSKPAEGADKKEPAESGSGGLFKAAGDFFGK